jgi:phosphonate transport system substrate-binding protein
MRTTRFRTALCAAITASLAAACSTSTAVEAASAPSAPAAAPTETDDATTLVLGSVSDDAEEEAEVYQPFADHLAGVLASSGVTRGGVRVAGSEEEMADLLRTGEVDVYIDSMGGVTSVVAAGAGEAVLRRWKDGAPTYHSVVVVRRDSGITDLSGLAGRTLAFENPDSTDGYLLPAATLLDRGVPLVRVAAADETVADGSIGYVFSGDDENTVFQVLEGTVDAGALSEEDLEENAGDRSDELATLVTSAEVPRHGVVLRTGIDVRLRDAITAALTTMHDDADGREALEAFEETARFDALEPESVDFFLRHSSQLSDGS